MKTSETLTKISPALLKAQKEITFAAKDTNNPFFKSKYADLPCVIDAIKKPLNDNGIVFVQSASPSDPGYLSMTTRLIHESGEWIEDTATIPLPKSDPQGYGSASTYGRRYGLAAITGLYQDDDDGNAATKSNNPAQTPLDVLKACTAIKNAETLAKAEYYADRAFDRATTDEERKQISDALKSYGEVA